MNELIESINSLEEVKKFKRLEKLIDQLKYNDKLNELFELQKQMINSKHYELDNNYYAYLEKYNKLKNDLIEDPLVSMYLDSLDEINDLLSVVTSIISKKINEFL